MSETMQTSAALTDLALRYLAGLLTEGEYDLAVAYITGYEDGMAGAACDPTRVVRE